MIDVLPVKIRKDFLIILLTSHSSSLVEKRTHNVCRPLSGNWFLLYLLFVKKIFNFIHSHNFLNLSGTGCTYAQRHKTLRLISPKTGVCLSC